MLILKVSDIAIGNINIQKAKGEVPRGLLQGRESLFQLGAYLLTPKQLSQPGAGKKRGGNAIPD